MDPMVLAAGSGSGSRSRLRTRPGGVRALRHRGGGGDGRAEPAAAAAGRARRWAGTSGTRSTSGWPISRPGAAPIDTRRLPPGARRALGAGGFADVALSSAARRALAGRAAGDRRRRAVLVRGVQRLGDRRARALQPRPPAHGRARGLRDRARPVRRSRRPSSCTTPPTTSGSSRATSGRRSRGELGTPTPAWRTWSAAARTGSPSGSAASTSGWWPTPPPAAPAGGAAGDLAVRGRSGRRAQPGAEPRGGPAGDRRARQTRRGARGARHHPPARPLRLGDLWLPRIPDRRAGRRIGRTRSSAIAATRRALALAVDRETLARSVFGREAKAPPGPMSQLLWIWNDSIATLPFDTAQADRALEAAGWRRAGRREAARSAEAGRWRSTSWCRARARRGASSPWRCRRCGRPSARR